jgi:hypothetical protein
LNSWISGSTFGKSAAAWSGHEGRDGKGVGVCAERAEESNGVGQLNSRMRTIKRTMTQPRITFQVALMFSLRWA